MINSFRKSDASCTQGALARSIENEAEASRSDSLAHSAARTVLGPRRDREESTVPAPPPTRRRVEESPPLSPQFMALYREAHALAVSQTPVRIDSVGFQFRDVSLTNFFQLRNAQIFFQRQREILGKIQTALRLKLEKGRMPRFDLDVGPGVKKVIVNIESLSITGKHFIVYKCEDSDGSMWVLKLYKPQAFTDFSQLIKHRAVQLMNYARIMNDREGLGLYLVPFLNFDGHLEATKGFLDASPPDQLKLFSEYTMKHVAQTFLFAKYVPYEFPVEFDRSNSCWEQVRDMFDLQKELILDNRLIRGNVRYEILPSGEKMAYMINLSGENGLGFPESERSKNISSFSDNPEVLKWFDSLPKTKLRENRTQNVIGDVGSNNPP